MKKTFLNNLKKLFYKKASLSAFFIWILIISLPSYFFTNSLQVIWNLWKAFYYTEITLTVIISLLFGTFLASSVYKFTFFSTKKYWIGLFWWFIWLVVSGCPACSITLASYLGLASIISVFPFYWIELKFVSAIMLLFVNYSIIWNLEVCRVKSKK